MTVESKQIFTLPGKILIYFSKRIGKFPSSRINYQMIIELMGTGVLTDKPITSHSVISNLKSFNKVDVEYYTH
jgi:hypothetical protein